MSIVRQTCAGLASAPPEQLCVGLTSSITRVRHGRQRRVVTGLVSGAGPDGTFAGGAHDVSVARRGGGRHHRLRVRQRPRRQGFESNPYSVYAASNRHQVVTDAAGDSVLEVRKAGCRCWR